MQNKVLVELDKATFDLLKNVSKEILCPIEDVCSIWLRGSAENLSMSDFCNLISGFKEKDD